MKKEAKILLHKSIDSLILSIEFFNRPWQTSREEAVLILLDRSFELFLKSVILHRGGKIRDKKSKETYGLDKCVRICLSDNDIKCLNEDQALTIKIINSLRDAAQHYMLDVSESQLYMYAQAGITLYSEKLIEVFNKNLSTYLPERVLPISTTPPKNLESLIDIEFKEIQELIYPGTRKKLQARAKLRSLAIIESSLEGICSQPGETEINKIIRKIESGNDWRNIFPGIAHLNLDTTGNGLTVSIKLTKKEGEPVKLVPEGTPGATIVAIKRVNELSYYSMGLYDLAKKINLTSTKCYAIVHELNLQDDLEYFKIIKIGGSISKRYSQKAFEKIKEELPNLNMDEVLERHSPNKKKT